jgi:1-acyl-sn-glycerol-3-phosphate acyltransferase
MMYQLNYRWRQFATGLSFTCFGLGGLVIPLLLLPVPLFIRDQDRRERFTKRLIHKSFRFFIELMRRLGILTYEVQGLDRLNRPGQLILANHPTLIDVVFLISFIPHADCVVKSSLLRNPFTRGPITAGRYIANDNPDAVIGAAQASMARGNSLIVFPEGTRTTPNQALKMQRGAANIAIRTANNITPVIIKCVPSTLTKQEKWYQIPSRKFHVSFRVMDELDTQPYLSDSPSVAARQLTKELQAYFTKETARDE